MLCSGCMDCYKWEVYTKYKGVFCYKALYFVIMLDFVTSPFGNNLEYFGYMGK